LIQLNPIRSEDRHIDPNRSEQFSPIQDEEHFTCDEAIRFISQADDEVKKQNDFVSNLRMGHGGGVALRSRVTADKTKYGSPSPMEIPSHQPPRTWMEAEKFSEGRGIFGGIPQANESQF
jgi:hypothetical protein